MNWTPSQDPLELLDVVVLPLATTALLSLVPGVGVETAALVADDATIATLETDATGADATGAAAAARFAGR